MATTMANPPEKTKERKLPPRAASLQRMLEMERKQKMERLQQQSPSAAAGANVPGRRGVSPASNSSSSSNSRPGLLHRRRESSVPRQQDGRMTPTSNTFALPPLIIDTQHSPGPRSSTSSINSTTSQERRPNKPAAEAKEKKDKDKGREKEKNKDLTPKGPKRPDRDGLPSVVRAAATTTTATHEPSHLKVVSFATDDGNQSDGSSICHSPTWDEFSKKKRKPAEEKRKRLSKQPPPATMENSLNNKPVMPPPLSSRTMSDTVLSTHPLRQSLESSTQQQQQQQQQPGQLNGAQVDKNNNNPTPAPPPLPRAHSSQPSGVESVETVARSPAFIGGVRLEREREAAMKRLLNARAPSAERPASEVLPSPTTPTSSTTTTTMTDVSKKRETAPAVSYPPTSTKTPFLKQQQKQQQPQHQQQPSDSSSGSRSRRGSFSSGIISAAGKLFGSKDKDSKNELGFAAKRNESQESVQTVQTLFFSQDRGRQVDGEAPTHARGSSYDSHERFTSRKEGRRGKLSLPPVSWKNQKKNRTTSMIAVPPDSARDGSFSPNRSPALAEDNFGFLERPFSPPVDSPLSPPASLSASMKAKMSPQLAATTASPTAPPRKAGKKKLKDAIKTGFRSSVTMPDLTPVQRARSATLDTLVGGSAEVEIPLPGAAQSSQGTAGGRTVAKEGQESRHHQSQADPKGSGASSSSSHPDSESQPPSPVTTPDTSRPQSSSKDNQTTRLEDQRKTSLQGSNALVRNIGVASGEPPSGYFAAAAAAASSSKGMGSPWINVDIPNVSQQNDFLLEEKPPSQQQQQQQLLTEDLWMRSKRQLDPDQLSFTSALTSIDVKRSFKDLNAAIIINPSSLRSPNGDVTPLSLDRDEQQYQQQNDLMGGSKITVQKVEIEVKQVPPTTPTTGFRNSTRQGQDFASRVSNSSLLSSMPHHQSMPAVRPVHHQHHTGQRLILNDDLDKRSFSSLHTRTDSPDSFAQQPSAKTSSAYLKEARRAAPSSPRAPSSKAGSGSSNLSLPPATTTASASSLLSGSRAFALSGPKMTAAAAAAAAATAVAPPSVPMVPSSSPLQHQHHHHHDEAAAAMVSSNNNNNNQTKDSNLLNRPIAKMLVECCHCKFYQDMPSRVYEAMARPDDIVKDKKLGVSGQVTTCVKCPWCSHNMSTVCCAGYAAVVYLREKLHGP